MSTADGELLDRVLKTKNFVRSALFEDDLDWGLAREYGVFLVRVNADDLCAHLILARAYRHLGDIQDAVSEFERCQDLVSRGNLAPVEREVLVPVIEKERRLLSK